jgi:hypothetical protein
LCGFIFLDGRVTQWLLRKGFESNGTKKENNESFFYLFFFFADYMKLKRILSKQTIQKREPGKDPKLSRTENLLFRTSGGLCFDVCPDDKTMYVLLFFSKKNSYIFQIFMWY